MTGVLTGIAAGAVALAKCVAITGPNTTFVPGVAVPYFSSGGYYYRLLGLLILGTLIGAGIGAASRRQRLER